MSTNFGEGAPAGFHACSQRFLTYDFGFTHTLSRQGSFTDCTAFFRGGLSREGFPGFMSGSPFGKEDRHRGCVAEKIMVARARPAPNINNLTPSAMVRCDRNHDCTPGFRKS
jgi:hypothetical protein